MKEKSTDIARSMSIRAKANNLAKRTGIAPQAVLQAYFSERFLARLSQSEYAGCAVIKGGTLMSALFGIAERTTMDIDTTLVGIPGDEASLRAAVESICKIDAGDGITFNMTGVAPIKKDDDYGGFGFSLTAELGTIRLALGVDVTVGDTITPKPTPFEYRRILESGEPIHLLAYTTETLLAEKLQTLLNRGAMTTRPRDFYDIHRLETSNRFTPQVLRAAVAATFKNRKSEALLPKRYEILESIEKSGTVRNLWQKYKDRFSYAKDITLEMTLASVKRLFDLLD